jgi:hypothetical protein
VRQLKAPRRCLIRAKLEGISSIGPSTLRIVRRASGDAMLNDALKLPFNLQFGTNRIFHFVPLASP